MTIIELIKKLRDKKITKWKISKHVGVSWNTVNMWEKGAFKPSDDKIKKITELL